MSNVEEHAREPVSYTHLDVYKRQVQELRQNRSTVISFTGYWSPDVREEFIMMTGNYRITGTPPDPSLLSLK